MSLDAEHPLSAAIDNVRFAVERLEEELVRHAAPRTMRRRAARLAAVIELIGDWAEADRRLEQADRLTNRERGAGP